MFNLLHTLRPVKNYEAHTSSLNVKYCAESRAHCCVASTMIAAVLGSFLNSFLLRHIFMLFEAHAETDSIFETGVWDNVTSTFYIPYVG